MQQGKTTMTATGRRIGVMAACLFGTASLCTLSGTAQAQTVADRSLSEVGVDHIGSCTTLTIRFNIRVQLLSYFPNGSGRELHIRLQSLDAGDMSSLRDSLRPPASVPDLRSIQFEGDNPAGPVLSLFFAQDMQFDVTAGRDPQSLVIRLSPPGVGPICADAQPAAVPPSSQHPNDAGRQLVIPEGLHVINLSSSPSAPGELTDAQQQALAGRVVYETLFERDSQQWHRLRAGFFESRAEAEAALPALQMLFPDAFVVKVSAEERTQGVASRLAGSALEPEAETSTATPEQETEAAGLVTEAESAIADQQEDRAIQILTNALQLPPNTSTPRALELLGLMRERKGQQAQARQRVALSEARALGALYTALGAVGGAYTELVYTLATTIAQMAMVTSRSSARGRQAPSTSSSPRRRSDSTMASQVGSPSTAVTTS